MATATINSTQPGATTGNVTANAATLRACLQKILEASRKNSSYKLAPDEYQLLWMIANAGNNGATDSVASAYTSVVLTYT